MAITLTSMLAQPFTTTSTNIKPRLTVSAMNYDTAALVAQTYRTYLASGVGAGTRTDPAQLMASTQGYFNAAVAGWVLRMRTDGRLEITNTAGTWAINWTVVHADGAIWRNLLGWTANIGSTAASTYAIADDYPTHCVYSMSRTGPPPQTMQASATGEKEDGTTYSIRSGKGFSRSTSDFGFAPLDLASRTALYAAFPAPTPARADVSRRWALSETPAAAIIQPWTWEDFTGTAGGYQLGAALGNFQDHVAGSTTTYDTCYLGAKSVGKLPIDWTQNGWSRSVTVRGIELRFSGSATRS